MIIDILEETIDLLCFLTKNDQEQIAQLNLNSLKTKLKLNYTLDQTLHSEQII
jgi:hypothetical protein